MLGEARLGGFEPLCPRETLSMEIVELARNTETYNTGGLSIKNISLNFLTETPRREGNVSK